MTKTLQQVDICVVLEYARNRGGDLSHVDVQVPERVLWAQEDREVQTIEYLETGVGESQGLEILARNQQRTRVAIDSGAKVAHGLQSDPQFHEEYPGKQFHQINLAGILPKLVRIYEF